jgi:predicted 3-demethylubiquinone-9 3-methyltransferase (glyoxalase superfamily)
VTIEEVLMPKINPFLWFDDQAESAAQFYVSVFPNSRITRVARYGEAGPGAAGSVMTVEFELDGQRVVALNGGPQFKFSEAVSLVVNCRDQAEIDLYWDRLGEGGEPGPCGWLKDRFGFSWQIVPENIEALLGGSDKASQRAFAAMMRMGKLDIAGLQAARSADAA